MEIVTKSLVSYLRSQFTLAWSGIHGLSHLARVRENGLRLARSTGADTDVVELFAFIHDSRRMSDGRDPEHGARAAELARSMEGEFYTIGKERLELLCAACRDHSKGYVEGDSTIQTCWDADRLDLGRIGIRPNPRYLCTVTAKNRKILEWAYKRSRERRKGSRY